MEDTIIYKHVVTFKDLIDSLPKDTWEKFHRMTEEEQAEWCKKNLRSCQMGFEFGLCDPVADVQGIVVSNLTIP